MLNIICIVSGASIGAILRWVISIKFNTFNSYFGIFPLGTLLVNIIGSYLIGILSSLFIFYNSSLELRLFIIVGFLGSFTTFSAFSIESIEFLRNSKFSLFTIHLFMNTFASIFMAGLGIITFYFLKKYFL